MHIVEDYRFKLGRSEFVPIVSGGMGVHFSRAELALEVCRLGGIGHLSDAMVPFVADQKFGTDFSSRKAERNRAACGSLDKSGVKFDVEDIYLAQFKHVQDAMQRKRGDGAVFINVMEKLTMGDPLQTLQARLLGALDGGIDGITLSAGLHSHSLKLIEDNPRFRHAFVGIIVSSCRALKIFLRSAQRSDRLPDFIVVEGPLAGGHLGFGQDWAQYDLAEIVIEILGFLKNEGLAIPVVPAGGIFTGSDAVRFLELGAQAVQVATRFTVTRECGIPASTQQKYFAATPDQVVVNCVSPTGYLMRMLSISPCLGDNSPPSCEVFGYILSKEGRCQYLDAYAETPCESTGRKGPVLGKICLCRHFSRSSCYTCGENVHRLKDTSNRKADGTYQILSAEHVFRDYQFSRDDKIALPEPELDAPAPTAQA